MVKSMAVMLCCLGMAACCADSRCPAFETLSGAQWMPSKNAGDLVFESAATGTQVVFKINGYTGTPAYKAESHWAGEGCTGSDCKVEGTMNAASAASSGGPYGELSIRVTGEYGMDVLYGETLKYTLGDFSTGFYTGPELRPYYSTANDQWEADSIVEDYTIGVHRYGKVVIQTKKPDPALSVQKVYLAEGFGVVAFVGKGELFALK